MTALDLPAIRALHAGVTPGPWEVEPVTDGRFAGLESRVYSFRGSHILLSPTDGEAGQATNANAAFIAAAPSIVAQLLARIDAVTELHRPARRNHTSYNSDGTLIAYTVTEDGPCVACYPDYITQHCEECEDYDDTCGGVTGPVIQPWPCPTIKAITGKASDDGS